MHAIFRGMSIKSICDIYPITVQGDIGDAQFEEKTNLWLVSCVEKYGRQEGEEEDFNTFMNYLLPSLLQLVSILENSNLNPVRREAYKSLHEMFWRSLKVFCKKVNEHDDFEQLIKIIRVAIPLVSDSTLEHIAMALQNLCLSLYEKEYSCKWAGELIAELAKKLDLAKNNAKQLLKAIKYLSTITDRQGYLNKRFDKNIQSLLNDKEKKS